MNGPQSSPPNWGAIFSRAHRRIAQRLMLLAGIGVGGALLLLSGGLTANGTITVFTPVNSKAKPKVVKDRPAHKAHDSHTSLVHDDEAPQGGHSSGPIDHGGISSIDKPRRCTTETSSSGVEYTYCLPRASGG